MQIGFVGLGRMGGNMVHRILRDSDNEVIAFDPSADARSAAEGHGAGTAASLEELVQKLSPPRMVWLMVPAGDITESSVQTLKGLLEPGDGMMVGGHEESVGRLAPILDVLAPPDGWRRFGDSGAGHFVKMVHNGVEYGIMQAYAEGFELLHKSEFSPDLKEVAGLWNRGSVIRSWLCELAERAFEQEGNDLEGIRGHVSDSGEGRWTIIDGIDLDVPTPVITASLYARFYSRGN